VVGLSKRCIQNCQAHLRNAIKDKSNKRTMKGGGVAELVAHPPKDPKVGGLNHLDPKYS
jgi:hypothetical protein